MCIEGEIFKCIGRHVLAMSEPISVFYGLFCSPRAKILDFLFNMSPFEARFSVEDISEKTGIKKNFVRNEMIKLWEFGLVDGEEGRYRIQREEREEEIVYIRELRRELSKYKIKPCGREVVTKARKRVKGREVFYKIFKSPSALVLDFFINRFRGGNEPCTIPETLKELGMRSFGEELIIRKFVGVNILEEGLNVEGRKAYALRESNLTSNILEMYETFAAILKKGRP